MQTEATAAGSLSGVEVVDIQPCAAFGLVEPLIDVLAQHAESGRLVELGDVACHETGIGRSTLIADNADVSFLCDALPLIVEFQVPVTAFVSTSAVESGTWIDHDRAPMSWRMLEEATATGLVTVGTCGYGIDPWRSIDVAHRSVEMSSALIEVRLEQAMAGVRCPGAPGEVLEALRSYIPVVIADG